MWGEAERGKKEAEAEWAAGVPAAGAPSMSRSGGRGGEGRRVDRMSMGRGGVDVSLLAGMGGRQGIKA